MTLLRNLTLTLLAATSLTACSLDPATVRPALPVPQTWPIAQPQTAASAADLAWREVFIDPRLAGTIELALKENRDLRVALLNIEQARAQYGIKRADLLPSISGTVSGTKSRTPGSVSQTGSAVESEQYSADVGFSSYELDLFGRVRSLSKAAFENWLEVRENRRTAQISLIAETANAWLTLASDEDLLQLARDTLAARDESLKLTQSRVDAGAASMTDLRQAQTQSEQARSDVAEYVAQVNQDKNALRLLVGADVPADLLPAGGLVTAQILADLPAGVVSDVLTRRPDVLAAEHDLAGANADIGAARAAFFPSISLTASTGSSSGDLKGLFKSGSGAWSFAPSISLPIFAGGANKASLDNAKAGQAIAVANYEKAVQTAFREVADALAVRDTIAERVGAQERLVAAATDNQRLVQQRKDAGIDSSLTLLDAQRTLYSAQQTLISARLVRASNLVTLYKVLGGGAPAS